MWKVGELAEATGLTVRTLHHWHEQGLVCPSARTASGYRLYAEDDVRRVYEVVALRELGLSLDAIGDVLDGRGPELGAVVEAHLAQVRDRLAALRSLESTLSTLVARMSLVGHPSPSDLLELINEVSAMSELFRSYFTDDQVAALQERRERLGDENVRRAAAEWPPLIERMQAEMAAGTDPADPRVQELVARWMELMEAFDGGDPGLREANHRMRRENADEVRRAGGPSEELVRYVARAQQAGGH